MKSYTNVTIKTWGVEIITCDDCGKRLTGPEARDNDWVEVSWGHDDWGLASGESGDRWDACSPACLLDLIGRAAEDYALAEGARSTFWLRIGGELSLEWAKALAFRGERSA